MVSVWHRHHHCPLHYIYVYSSLFVAKVRNILQSYSVSLTKSYVNVCLLPQEKAPTSFYYEISSGDNIWMWRPSTRMIKSSYV